MSKVSIELDLKVVQEAIHAKVKPAVDEILSKVDISALIQHELLREPTDEDRRAAFFPMIGYREPRRPIDEMISAAVRDAAKTYVNNVMDHDILKIEAAFAKMVAKSQNALAKAMVGAMVEGMKDNDWRFELSTTVTPTFPNYD